MILVAGILFSVADAFSKELARTLPAVEIAWLRWIGLVALVFPVLGRSGGTVLRTRAKGLEALRSVCLIGSSLLFITGLSYLPLASATTINLGSPLFVTAPAAPFLGEKVGAQDRMLGRGIDRRAPDRAGIAIALQRRADEQRARLEAETIRKVGVEPQEGAGLDDVAEKRMIEDDEIEIARRLGDGLVLETGQGPVGPVDREAGMARREDAGELRQRAGGAPMAPGQSLQCDGLGHTESGFGERSSRRARPAVTCAWRCGTPSA